MPDGVQETLKLLKLTFTALKLVGKLATVGEKGSDNLSISLQNHVQDSLPTTVRFLVLPEGVLLLDTLHSYCPGSLPVTVSVLV